MTTFKPGSHFPPGLREIFKGEKKIRKRKRRRKKIEDKEEESMRKRI